MKKNLFRVLFCLFALGVLPSSTPAQQAYREIQVAKPGSVRGVVRYSGNAAAVKEIAIKTDVQSCGNKKVLPYLVLGKDQGVKNAIVTIEGIQAGKPWKKQASYVFNQDRCEYDPHILLMPAGSQLEILNSDTILHNVHTYELTGELKTVFNVAQPIKGLRTKLEMTSPGYIAATCDAGHPWMSAFIKVLDSPYSVISDADGNFALDQVPPGTYKVTMWHEPLTVGSEAKMENMQQHYFEKPIVVTKDVTVTAGGTATVNFDFK